MSLGQDFRSTVECLAFIGSSEHSGRDGSPVYRGSTTAGERLAAEALSERLSADGWQVERQRFTGHSSFGLRFVVHVAAVTAASALIPVAPAVTLAVTLVVALSLFVEQSRQVRVLSRLLPTAPSQNLQAQLPCYDGARPTIVLCAHYDTQRTGWCMSDSVQRLSELTWFLPVTLRVLFIPETLAIIAQVVLASAAVVRPLTPVGWGILVIIGLTHVVFLVMFTNFACGRFVPGAADNATGVAAVLLLAERWQADPVAGVDLMVLLTGCEETGMLGAAAWASANQRMRKLCAFLNLDGLGFGPPHYLLAEVPVVGLPRRYDRRMLALAGTVASLMEKPARGIALPGPTDGLALLARGFRGLTVVGCQPNGRLPFWHQPGDTPDHVDFGNAQDGLEFSWLLLRAMAEDLRATVGLSTEVSTMTCDKSVLLSGSNRRANERAGFTLVELLTVIGIIAVLMALLLPALRGARETANQTKCAAQLRQIGIAFESYANENRGWLPAWSSGWKTWPVGLPEDTPGPAWTIELIPYIGAAPDSPVYSCPSFPDRLRNYFIEAVWAYVNGHNAMKLSDIKLSSEFLLSGEVTQLRAYPPPYGDPEHLTNDADFSDEWGPLLMFPDQGGFIMHRGGDNILFADMHVGTFTAFDPALITFHPRTPRSWEQVSSGGPD